MLLDSRACWTREDVAEYLGIDPKTVDRLVKPKLPPTSYVGRLPRWKAEKVMEAFESGLFDVRHRCGNASETRADA